MFSAVSVFSEDFMNPPAALCREVANWECDSQRG
jgi:hypothetical protein